DASAHKLEFLEWLKIKAKCPSCERELDIWEFQKILEQNKEVDEKYPLACPNCKKYIPIDANFCIYCGFKI
ncbi:MAG: zinc ribbon domain-containing protein, partial [Candidatus Hodarchaeota archaeon]